MKKLCLGTFAFSLLASTSSIAASSYVSDIKVTGLERVEPETVISYIDIKVGNNEHNKMYLIEFTINSEGKIFQHKVWRY